MAEKLSLQEIREQIEKTALLLSVPHKRFCDEYLANGNVAYKAYLAVFQTNNKNVASRKAWKLMKRHGVREYINLCKRFTTEELLNHLTVSKERVLDEEAKLAFADIRNMFDDNGELLPPTKWPEEIARAASGIDIDQRWDSVNEKWQYKYKIKLNDKGRALQRLETVLGMNKAAELTDKDSDLFKDFLTSIDGKSRGILPSQMQDEEDEDE